MNENLQSRILKLFKSKDTFNNPKWGFSAIGHRDVAIQLRISNTSASNSMRAMLKNGIFYSRTSKDKYDQTTYFLKNEL